LTAKLHSRYVKESGVGVGNFGKDGVDLYILRPTPQPCFAL